MRGERPLMLPYIRAPTLFDGRSKEETMATKLKPVDAVVVGTGVVGSIMAKELADAGLKVVALERGRMIDPQHDFAAPSTYDELKFDRHSDIFQDLSRETLTFRNNS